VDDSGRFRSSLIQLGVDYPLLATNNEVNSEDRHKMATSPDSCLAQFVLYSCKPRKQQESEHMTLITHGAVADEAINKGMYDIV
jgi:hypothetical protein